VIQLALVVAFHWQPDGAVIVTEPVPPPLPVVCAAGEIEYEQTVVGSVGDCWSQLTSAMDPHAASAATIHWRELIRASSRTSANGPPPNAVTIDGFVAVYAAFPPRSRAAAVGSPSWCREGVAVSIDAAPRSAQQ
jgi:hypothetical protein